VLSLSADVIKSTISLTVLVPSTIRSNSFSRGSWNASSWDWRRDELKKCPSRCCSRSARTLWEHFRRTKTNFAGWFSTNTTIYHSLVLLIQHYTTWYQQWYVYLTGVKSLGISKICFKAPRTICRGAENWRTEVYPSPVNYGSSRVCGTPLLKTVFVKFILWLIKRRY